MILKLYLIKWGNNLCLKESLLKLMICMEVIVLVLKIEKNIILGDLRVNEIFFFGGNYLLFVREYNWIVGEFWKV